MGYSGLECLNQHLDKPHLVLQVSRKGSQPTRNLRQIRFGIHVLYAWDRRLQKPPERRSVGHSGRKSRGPPQRATTAPTPTRTILPSRPKSPPIHYLNAVVIDSFTMDPSCSSVIATAVFLDC